MSTLLWCPHEEVKAVLLPHLSSHQTRNSRRARFSYMMATPSCGSSTSGKDRKHYGAEGPITPVERQLPAFFPSHSSLKLSPASLGSMGPLPRDQQLHARGTGKLPDGPSVSSFLTRGRTPVPPAQLLKFQRIQFAKINVQPHFGYHCLYLKTGLCFI